MRQGSSSRNKISSDQNSSRAFFQPINLQNYSFNLESSHSQRKTMEEQVQTDRLLECESSQFESFNLANPKDYAYLLTQGPGLIPGGRKLMDSQAFAENAKFVQLLNQRQRRAVSYQ